MQPESSREAADEIEMLAAPVKAFIRDRCKVGAGLTVGHNELWLAFRAWSDDEGRDAGTKAWFGRNLRSAEPGITNVRPRPEKPGRDGSRKPKKNNSRERIYSGIELLASKQEQTFTTAAVTNKPK